MQSQTETVQEPQEQVLVPGLKPKKGEEQEQAGQKQQPQPQKPEQELGRGPEPEPEPEPEQEQGQDQGQEQSWAQRRSGYPRRATSLFALHPPSLRPTVGSRLLYSHKMVLQTPALTRRARPRH